MIAVSKSRIASALLFSLLMLVLPIGVKSADVPLSRTPGASSRVNAAIPLHAARPIPRQEIYKVIQAELERRGILGGAGLRPEDLTIQPVVPEPLIEKGLQVKRIRFDSFRRAIVFEVWAPQAPQFLPFEVTLRGRRELISKLEAGLSNAGESVETDQSGLSQGAGVVRSKPPVLAKPGTLATLTMFGQNVRVTTTVVPLQPGAKGQSILVRDVSSERVITAEVVDVNLLQVRF